MTIFIAGGVDVDFQTFVIFAVIAIAAGAWLTAYFARRRLTGGQWLAGVCFYLSVALFFFWFHEIRLPDYRLDAVFRAVQPFLSIVLVVAALIAGRTKKSVPKIQ
jgi:hypothetical protein